MTKAMLMRHDRPPRARARVAGYFRPGQGRRVSELRSRYIDRSDASPSRRSRAERPIARAGHPRGQVGVIALRVQCTELLHAS